VRTAQRWEREFNLPVRRPSGRRRSAVIALTSEINAWLQGQDGAWAIAAKAANLSLNRTIPLGIASLNVRVGDHVLFFWESEGEFRAVAGFFSAGIRAGDHFVVLGSAEANEKLVRLLEEAGLNISQLRAQARLTILNPQKPQLALAAGLSAIQDALGRGAPMVRVLSTVAGSHQGDGGDKDSTIALERAAERVTRSLPVVILCPYNVNILSGRAIVKAGLENHSMLIHRNFGHVNPLYSVL
jgi:hypothetical protein